MPGPASHPATLSRRQLLLLATTAPLAVQAQDATFSTEVELVNLFATVRDRDGNLVTGLTRDDFELADDGRTVAIQYFAAETDLPLTLGILFDLSGSQRTVIDEQRSAASSFLAETLSGAHASSSQGLLIGFNRAVQLVQFPTSSRAALEAGLAKLSVPRDEEGKLLPRAEGTALFDAILGASSVLQSQSGRKVIALISDGVDTFSSTTFEEALQAALRADVIVYPIRVYDQGVFRYNVGGPVRENLRRGEKLLRELAEKTGGTVFDIEEGVTLNAAFARLNQELRGQYSLAFSPLPARDARRDYHPLRLRLRSQLRRQGLTVASRDGYYSRQ